MQGFSEVYQYSPERLTVSLKVNSRAKMPIGNSSMYSLEQINLLYKKRPLEDEHLASDNGRNKVVSSSRPKTLRGKEIDYEGNGKRQFHDDSVKLRNSQSSCQEHLNMTAEHNFKRSRFKGSNTQTSSVLARESNVRQSRILEPKRNFFRDDDSLSNSQSISKLLKKHSTLLKIIKHCRNNLDKSIDDCSRRNYENSYLTAMEKIAIIEKSLEDLGYIGMQEQTRTGNDESRIDHNTSKSLMQRDAVFNHSQMTSSGKKNSSRFARLQGEKPPRYLSKPSFQASPTHPNLSTLASYQTRDKTRDNTETGHYQNKLKMTPEEHIKFPKSVTRITKNDEHFHKSSSNFSYISSPLLSRELQHSPVKEKAKIVPQGAHKLNSVAEGPMYGEHHIGRKEATLPEGFMQQSTKSSADETKLNKKEILTLVVNLRKKYMHYQKRIKHCRRKLADEIATKELREKIENDYFNTQVKTENIRHHLKMLAEKLGCSLAKFFTILKIDQDNLGTSVSNQSNSYENDDNMDQFLRNNLSILSDTTESIGGSVFSNQFESLSNDGINDGNKYLHKDHSGLSFESDENYDKGRFSNYQSLDGSIQSLNENKRKDQINKRINLKSTGVQTDDNSYFKQEKNEFFLNDIDSSVENERVTDLNVKRPEELEEKLLEDVETSYLQSPSEFENLEKLRNKRLAFFRKNYLNPSKEDLVERQELEEMNSTSFDYKESANLEIYKSEISVNDSDLLLPLVPRDRKVKEFIDTGSDSEYGSEFSKNPVIYDVADVKSQNSEDDILYERELRKRLLQPMKRDIDKNNNDWCEDLNDVEDEINVKLYDVDDLESKEIDKNARIKASALPLRREVDPTYSESAPSIMRGKVSEMDDNDGESRSSPSKELSIESKTEKFLSISDLDTTNPANSYKSILDIDNETLFADSEPVLEVENNKEQVGLVNNDVQLLLNSDFCEDETQTGTVNGFGDMREKGDAPLDSTLGAVFSIVFPKQKIELAVQEPEIEASQVFEEESAFIEERFFDFDDKNHEEDMVCPQENLQESDDKQLDVDEDTVDIRFTVPNLKDSIRDVLIKDEDSERYLDFVLGDDEEGFSEFAVDFGKETENDKQRIMYLEEESSAQEERQEQVGTQEVQDASPRVETMYIEEDFSGQEEPQEQEEAQNLEEMSQKVETMYLEENFSGQEPQGEEGTQELEEKSPRVQMIEEDFSGKEEPQDEEEAQQLEVMSPRVETMPTEGSLALSLKQSLDLLDELEAYEAIDINGNEPKVGISEFDQDESNIMPDETDNMLDRYWKNEDLEAESTEKELEYQGILDSNDEDEEINVKLYDVDDLEELSTEADELTLHNNILTSELQSLTAGVPGNVPDKFEIDENITKDFVEPLVNSDQESGANALEFQELDSDTNILVEDTSFGDKQDSDTDASDDSVCSVLRSPLKNATNSEEINDVYLEDEGIEKGQLIEALGESPEDFADNKDGVCESLPNEESEIREAIENEEEAIKYEVGCNIAEVESSKLEENSKVYHEGISQKDTFSFNDAFTSNINIEDANVNSFNFNKEDGNMDDIILRGQEVLNAEKSGDEEFQTSLDPFHDIIPGEEVLNPLVIDSDFLEGDAEGLGLEEQTLLERDHSAEPEHPEILHDFSEVLPDKEILNDFDTSFKFEAELNDASEIDPEKDWIDPRVLEETIDDSEPTGIVNAAVVEELENENINKTQNIPPRPASDLRDEYQARLDLLSLPADLCDNLPLKLPSLSSSDSEDLFLKFQEEEDENKDDASSDGTFSGRSLSDSEPEIQFGPGYLSQKQTEDEDANAEATDVLSESEKQSSTENLSEKSIEGDLIEISDVDVQQVNPIPVVERFKENEMAPGDESEGNESPNHVFENQWFESVNLESKQAEKRTSSVEKPHQSPEKDDERYPELPKETEQVDGGRETTLKEPNQGEENFLEIKQRETEQLEEMFGIEDFSEISSCETSFRESYEEDQKSQSSRKEDLTETKLRYDGDQVDVADSSSQDRSGHNKQIINASESDIPVVEEDREAKNGSEEYSTKYATHDRLIDVLNEIEITTKETGSLVEDAELEEFEEFELMFENEAEEPENIDSSADGREIKEKIKTADEEEGGKKHEGLEEFHLMFENKAEESKIIVYSFTDGHNIEDKVGTTEDAENGEKHEMLEEFDLMFENEDKDSESIFHSSSIAQEIEDTLKSADEEDNGNLEREKESEKKNTEIENEEQKEIKYEKECLEKEEDNFKQGREEDGIEERRTENQDNNDVTEEDVSYQSRGGEESYHEKETRTSQANKETMDIMTDEENDFEGDFIDMENSFEECQPNVITAKADLVDSKSSSLNEQKGAELIGNFSRNNATLEFDTRVPESDVTYTEETNSEKLTDIEDKTSRCEVQQSPPSSSQIPDFATPVVIDNGSGYTKAGLSSNETPSVVIPAIIGKPHYEQIMHDPNTKEFYVGEEAERYRGVLKLSYPLEHGIVTDWDDLEKLWDHVLLQQLRIDPSEHPMLLTEAPLNPKKNRERMLEIMMETYQVPAFYIAIQAVMSLYVTGKTTGIVLDSGDGVTHIVPVYDGYSLPHATERMDIAGRDLTEYLMRIFMERGYSFTTSAEKEICKDIKEKLCFVAQDFDESIAEFQSSSDKTKSYMLPDGQVIRVGNEQFRCPEILFQPSLIGRDIPGVHEYLYKSIQRCDVDLRSELYSNIVLSGGTTLLEGIDERLKVELSRLSPVKMNEITKIRSLAARRFSVWCGAAALASMSTFSRMWITAEEYYDCGVDIVHRKCF